MAQQIIHFYRDFETEMLISVQFPQENFLKNFFPLLASWLSLLFYFLGSFYFCFNWLSLKSTEKK